MVLLWKSLSNPRWCQCCAMLRKVAQMVSVQGPNGTQPHLRKDGRWVDMAPHYIPATLAHTTPPCLTQPQPTPPHTTQSHPTPFHNLDTTSTKFNKTSTKLRQNFDETSTQLWQNTSKTKDMHRIRQHFDKGAEFDTISTKPRQNFDKVSTKLRQNFDTVTTQIQQNFGITWKTLLQKMQKCWQGFDHWLTNF